MEKKYYKLQLQTANTPPPPPSHTHTHTTMTTTREFGKDKVIFMTEEEAAKPSTVELRTEEEAPVGLITPEGEINWNCPCLGGMAVGPCGVEFR